MFEPILERKIKVALVGCGRISANHFNAIEQHTDNLALVGICDTNPENLSKAQERTKAQAFNHLDDLLNQTDADLIVLTTPSGLHPEQAIQSLKAGFHVLTEKPMATRLF
ncbi:MAG: Gfo/Idh/MocA family oxidoreductase, partial [Neisseriaceae bacterium]|nr:Gfo/Idh/MocA family oxidoreductase [Neisseriaceae bacterium]